MIKIQNDELKKIIETSLYESIFQTKEYDSTKNPLRSSLFVSKMGDQLSEKLNDNFTAHYIKTNPDGTKESGEWLLDIAITETLNIEEGYGPSGINTKLIWAIESESDTSLSGFAIDFGKLLCIQSINYLYLNGVNQKTTEGKEIYIEKRLNTVKQLLKKNTNCQLFNEKFYFCFWPSPTTWRELDNYYDDYQRMQTESYELEDIIAQDILNGKFTHLSEIDLYQYKNNNWHKI